MSERVEIILRLKSGKEFRFFVSEYQIKRFKLDGALSEFSFKDGFGEVPVYFEAQDVESISVVTPVEPKRPKGEWILECDAEGEGDNLYRCPECGQKCGCQEYDLPNFCPNCGADMRGAV